MMKSFLCLLFLSYTFSAFAQKDTLAISKLIDDAMAMENANPRKALELYDKTYLLSLKANYKTGIYKSLFNSGFPYSAMGNYDSAIYRFNKTIIFCKKNNMPIGIAKAQANIANSYQYKGDYNGAIKNYLLAIKSFEKLKDSISTATSYKNLSAIYTQYNNEKLEFYYLKKAEQFYQKSDFYSLGLLYNDMAIGYLRYDHFPEALIYLKNAEKMSKKAPNLDLQFYVVRNYGEYYRIKKEYNKAIPFYEKALKLADDAVDAVRKCDLIYIISELYLQTEDYPKALQFASKSLQLSKEIKAKDIEYKALKKLSLIYNKLNQPQKAYDLLEKSSVVKDSIFSKENAKEISLLQTQFESEKKDKALGEQKSLLNINEIEILRKDKQMSFYTLLIASLLLILIGIYLFFNQRQINKNKEIASLKQQQEISQLEALIDGEEKERRRIAQELHDGINGDLSAIKYRISSLEDYGLGVEEKADIQKIIEMIDYSCSQVRTISHNLMPASILDFGLVETVKEYCAKINSSHAIELDFQYYGNYTNLPTKSETVIFRIIQELINNIVKHSKATTALVQFNFHENELFITVEDNGIGFEKATVEKGLGLKNIASRVNFLNAEIDIDSSEKGSTFQIIIDLKKI